MKSLEQTLIDAWSLLTNGVKDRHSAYHLVKVATVTPDGRPSQRTVVLRDADDDTWTLRFHTDRRSNKVSELGANPAICVLFYDALEKVQLRVDGRAVVHMDDGVSEAAWAATRSFSKACYLAPDAPGTAVSEPPSAPKFDPGEDHVAYEHFCAVRIHVERLEWLHLDARGHRRAAFTRDSDRQVSMSWISP